MHSRLLLLLAVSVGTVACNRDYGLRDEEVAENVPPAPADDEAWAPVIDTGASAHLEPTPVPVLGTVPTAAGSECDPDAADVLPPALMAEDFCPSMNLGTWHSGSLELAQGQAGGVGGILSVAAPGWYDFYGRPMGGSTNAPNQAAWLQVPSSTRPFGNPLHTNCDEAWVAHDMDGVADPGPGMLVYLGTFRLQSGDNDVQLRHYCELYDVGACNWPHSDVSGAACGEGEPNLVHLEGARLCVIPAQGTTGRSGGLATWER